MDAIRHMAGVAMEAAISYVIISKAQRPTQISWYTCFDIDMSS